ncbi:MAG: hypothetical protein IJ685_07960 [Selenomonadaceae bacterium]|nr:hypothetical protein [Selenomonadaceae bacterium]
MKKFFTAALLAGILFFPTTGVAEIQTFDGTGKYFVSDFETGEIGQQHAVIRAKRDACDKAEVYLKAFCQMRDIDLTDDEIAAIVHNVIMIDDVHAEKKITDINGELVLIWIATVKATIDTEAVNKFIMRKDKS